MSHNQVAQDMMLWLENIPKVQSFSFDFRYLEQSRKPTILAIILETPMGKMLCKRKLILSLHTLSFIKIKAI
jgi:hypothetical protein